MAGPAPVVDRPDFDPVTQPRSRGFVCAQGRDHLGDQENRWPNGLDTSS
jgi:hypothetical protein